MKLRACLSLLGVLWLAGCGDHQDTTAKSTNSSSGGGNPLNAPADYLNALANGQKTAVKVVDVTSLNQAAQLFNAQEGRFPKDLNELVTSKMIAYIPAAPAGMKLDYDPATGTVKAVSK